MSSKFDYGKTLEILQGILLDSGRSTIAMTQFELFVRDLKCKLPYLGNHQCDWTKLGLRIDHCTVPYTLNPKHPEPQSPNPSTLNSKLLNPKP